MIQEVYASDFASIADLEGYQRAKARGMTDVEAFAHGDNGQGCWGDLTAQTHTPMCALPPETMAEWFGSVDGARHKRVLVIHAGQSVETIVADRMPHRKNITNGCGIDLNPAAIRELGLTSPVKAKVTIGPVEKAEAV